MAPNPVNHDPVLSHAGTAPPTQPPAQQMQGVPQTLLPPDLANIPLQGLSGLDPAQLINLIKNLPGVFNKLAEPGQSKEDAAQTLSNLSQGQAPFQPAPGQQNPFTGQHGMPGINDPGPSSHPRGPPSLGQLSQLSALAMSAAPASAPRPGIQPGQPQEMEEPSEEEHQQGGMSQAQNDGSGSTPSSTRRGGRSATMGSDEWARQRKDNHVSHFLRLPLSHLAKLSFLSCRRKLSVGDVVTLTKALTNLARIVPNGSGEKSKGAILSRAVQYIHHLKENEARNIEKWTLEKLLMDQAMGDLQTQLEELKKAWEAEHRQRSIFEMELQVLKGQQQIDAATAAAATINANAAAAAAAAAANGTTATQQKSPTSASPKVEGESLKRSADGVAEEGEDKEGKRQRTE